jgi:hypothetical protein
MDGSDILLCFYILLVILILAHLARLPIWGTVYAIRGLSKKGQTCLATPSDGVEQVRSGSPVDGFKRDYKRLITVLKISSFVLINAPCPAHLWQH